MEENQPKPVTKNGMEIILDQINNSICWIKKKEGNIEIGFLVYLKYKNKRIHVLMTKYNIMEGYNDKILNITLNDKNKIIKLGNRRYQNKAYDLAIIEIIEDKNDNLKFLEIDDNLFNKEKKIHYDKESIYIMQYNYQKDISVSFGIIRGISKDRIDYSCYINNNSKGLPIFNLSNYKIIGIHETKYIYHNKGILLNNIIKKFFDEDKNEIVLLINIDAKEIRKEKYFIDNHDHHDNLKELNELNTELYIDNNNYKFNKYFIPMHTGNYNIKLKFNFNLTDCSYMFAYCTNIIDIDLSHFKTRYIKNMEYMFYKCDIKKINLFSFDTVNVKYMNCMFGYCKNLKELDINFFDIKNVVNISGMFEKCSSLKSLPDISKWNTINITDISGIFEGCSSLNSLPDISKWNIKNIINISSMFKGCSSLKVLPDISKWNKIKLNINNISEIFKGCSSIESIPDISNLYIKEVTDMNGMFEGCSSLKLLPDLSSWKTKKVTNIKNFFKGCSSLKSLPDISNWNTINITGMSGMFAGCSSLISLPDISKWNTINITDISRLFEGCSSVISFPDISKWNTINFTDMSRVFDGCSSLISLPDISKWNIKNTKNISSMFNGCSSLKLLPDISKWNIKNIIDMSCLFNGCSLIESLPDISKWNIKNNMNISSMFEGCSSLKSLPDISNWIIGKEIVVGGIIKECFSLETISGKSLPEINWEDPIKVVLTGESGVGCQSLVRAALGLEFIECSEAVQSWSCSETYVFYNNKGFKANIWNGPGQERYKFYFKLFSKEADIILFVYDISMKVSLEDLVSRIIIAKEVNGDKFQGLIVANKSDLFMEQTIDDEEGIKLAKNYNFEFYSASAKDNADGFRNYLKKLIVNYVQTKVKINSFTKIINSLKK